MSETDLTPSIKSNFLTKVEGFLYAPIKQDDLDVSLQFQWRLLWRLEREIRKTTGYQEANRISAQVEKLRLIIGDMEKVARL